MKFQPRKISKSKAILVQSYSMATLFSAVVLMFSIPLTARAQSLRDCVFKYQRDFGVSADEALRQCRRYGEESPAPRSEERADCLQSLRGSVYSKDQRVQVCEQTGASGAKCLLSLRGSVYSNDERVQVCEQTGASGAQCLLNLRGSSYSNSQRVRTCSRR
jgi:hypothetical protein